MDGGNDAKHQFELSGEIKPPQVIVGGPSSGPEMLASQIAALNLSKREYQKEYMDYWNSTAALTGTGRPVDGVICPNAPFAAVKPAEYNYIGYSAFVNVLDYPSITIPVTFANKTVDVLPSDVSMDEAEPYIEWDCKFSTPTPHAAMSFSDLAVDDADTYHGAPVGVQLIGRRLQEEKVLTLAEYIGEEVARHIA